MSESQQRDQEGGSKWPEGGGVWEKEGMDYGLQAMAEEDEDINFYNDETFGVDGDVEEKGSNIVAPLPTDHLVLRVSPPPSPTLLLPPPRHKEQLVPLGMQEQRIGRRGQGGGVRGARIRAQIFEDPAVVRTIVGRPSLKLMDSAIVDCGEALPWAAIERAAWMVPSCGKNRMTGPILEDDSIVCVIDSHGGRGHCGTSQILDSPYCFSGYRGWKAMPRGGPFSNRPFSPRPAPLHKNWPQTPKMMQLRFGAKSPGPSPFHSPSSIHVQPFRCPGPITQLHPEHMRLLSQKPTAERTVKSWDPYCNLMTLKEKEWITKLQMIQLQTENPYLEDYYYQEYYRRMEARLEDKLGMRRKTDPPKFFTPYITKTGPYTPVVHIEGSLGQVVVSTCYTPRRAIGAVSANPTQVPPEEPKDTKTHQLGIRMLIENLFVVLLEIEEGERMKCKVFAEVVEKKIKESTLRKVHHILTQLQHCDALETGVEFLSCLMFSKGKKLISRLLPFLDHAAGLRILTVVTCHLPTLMSQDTDEVLPVLYPSLRMVISRLTFSQLIVILKNLTTPGETLEGPGCLMQICQNKFGLSLLYTLLSQGECLLSCGDPLDPSVGDSETWTDTIFLVASKLSQCSLVKPLFLPSNLLSLFLRYLDKRTIYQIKSNIKSATELALPS